MCVCVCVRVRARVCKLLLLRRGGVKGMSNKTVVRCTMKDEIQTAVHTRMVSTLIF